MRLQPDDPLSLSPKDFELFVRSLIDASADDLVDYESVHLEELDGIDGTYTLDVVARFSALGARFTVVVECKHHRRKIERKDVQILHSKLVSLGAQKGMLFSVAGFQSGAVEYAETHGIALVTIADGKSNWFTRSKDTSVQPPEWLNLPRYIGWLQQGNRFSVVSETDSKYLKEFLLSEHIL